MSQEPFPTQVPKREVRLWVQILIWLGLLGLLAVLAASLLKARHPIMTVGSKVPDFSLTFFKGYEYNNTPQVKRSDLLGKVIVVNFWASWCQPCAIEAPEVEAAWKVYQQSGKVLFLGVDYVDTEPEARSYLKQFNISYPNGPDLGMKISGLFNRNLGVPETYIIDQQGILQFTQIGPFQSAAEIQAILDPLIAGK
jgi:cytochrome c biogenesis protein CcmG, thiol:disulfide interchange protein DsbE